MDAPSDNDESRADDEPPPACEDVDEPRKYICQYAGCRQQFKHSSALNRHVRRHTDERPYACSYIYCNKRFRESGALALHERVHTGERPFVCSVPDCGKAFKASGALSRHGRVHADRRPFLCDFESCGKAFKDSCALKVHRRVHTGERPYACEHPGCGKHFKESGTLQRHVGLHTRQQLQHALAQPALLLPPLQQPGGGPCARMQTAYAQPIFPHAQPPLDFHPCAAFGFAFAPPGCCGGYAQLDAAPPPHAQQPHFAPAPHLAHAVATSAHGGVLAPFLFDYGPPPPPQHCPMGAMLHATNAAALPGAAAQHAVYDVYQPSAPALPAASSAAAGGAAGAPRQPLPGAQQGWTAPPPFGPGALF